jgi:hypothetical protein
MLESVSYYDASNESELDKITETGLKQIEDRYYNEQTKADGITNVVKVIWIVTRISLKI